MSDWMNEALMRGYCLSSYAYVDFATKDAKTVAISLSERNLHGRRLLIKDGQLSITFSVCSPPNLL